MINDDKNLNSRNERRKKETVLNNFLSLGLELYYCRQGAET